MKLRDTSLGERIGAGFLAVLVLLGVQLWMAVSGLARVERIEQVVAAHVEPATDAAAQLERSVLYRAIAVRNLVATGDRAFREAYERALAAGQAAVERLAFAPVDPPTRDVRTALARAHADYVRASSAYLDALDRSAPREALAAREGDLANVRTRLLGTVRELQEHEARRADAARAQVEGARGDVRRTLFGLAALVAAALGLTAAVTVRAVRRPAQRLVAAARALERGDFEPALAAAPGGRTGAGPMRDELREVAHAIANMARALRDREERLAAKGRLSAALGATLDLGDMAERALREIVAYAGADAGALYVLDEDGRRLHRAAGVCLGDGAEELPADGGLVGEVLRGGHPVALADLPADSPFRLGVGGGWIAPRAVAAAPLSAGGALVGFVFIAAVGALRKDAVAFLEASSAQLAVGLHNAVAHARSERLASDLGAANERLQAQNGALQVQADEIQAQAAEIRVQATEIERQNERLRVSGEALGDRARSLEDLDRRKDEFLAALSHELRNPMAAIAGAARVLETKGRPSPEVQIIARQVHHLGRLVDDLLDLSRISHGKIELRRERIDAREVVERAAEAVRARADAKGVRLRVAVGDRPLGVDADPSRLEQVVTNLLHNGVKYTPTGGRVDVRAAERGGRVELRVRDSGIGIDPDLMPRLFQPFTQGERTDGVEQGLGLGLALVRQLVEMHGGDVEARSDGSGRGSEFTVRLPACALEAPSRRPAPAAAAPARRTEGLHVLVVDDNEDVAETMAEMLRFFGHEPVVAFEPEEGLRACLANPPDVALLDIGLPGMDGYDLARAIRARLPAGARTRLVAVTGYGQPEDRARAWSAGFDLHLVKPVDPDDLRDALERLVEPESLPAA